MHFAKNGVTQGASVVHRRFHCTCNRRALCRSKEVRTKETSELERKKKYKPVESNQRMETSPGVPKDWLLDETWGRICHFAPPRAKCHLRATGAQCLCPPILLSLSFEAIAFLSVISKIQVPNCNRFYANRIPCSLLHNSFLYARYNSVTEMSSVNYCCVFGVQTRVYVDTYCVSPTSILFCIFLLSVNLTFLFILASFNFINSFLNFCRIRKNCEKRLLASSCLSVHIFAWTDFGEIWFLFSKICRENSRFSKTWQ
jgi:hypothetical protein